MYPLKTLFSKSQSLEELTLAYKELEADIGDRVEWAQINADEQAADLPRSRVKELSGKIRKIDQILKIIIESMEELVSSFQKNDFPKIKVLGDQVSEIDPHNVYLVNLLNNFNND